VKPNLEKPHIKILVIVPVLAGFWEELTKKELSKAARADTKIDVVGLKKGPVSIECEYDEVFAALELIEKVKEAERNGYDAVLIGCFTDPCIYAAKEAVKIPVVAPAEASMAISSILGEKFSVILPKIIGRGAYGIVKRQAKTYGFESKLASVRSIKIHVLDFIKMREELKAAILEEAKKAIDLDGADTIILGCGGMIGIAKEVQETIKIPVVDPIMAALKFAEMVVDMKISHSKIAYPTPPPKERKT